VENFARSVPPLVQLLFFSLSVTNVFFEMDPLHFIFYNTLKTKKHNLSGSYNFYSVRLCLQFVILAGCEVIAWTVVFTVFELYIVSHSLFHLKSWSDAYTTANNVQAIDCKSKVNDLPSVTIMPKMHTRLKIIETKAYDVFYVELPPMLLLGSIVLIFANFATITMRSKIPMPYFLSMPFVSFLCVCGIKILFPPASQVHEDSQRFLKQIKILVYKQKHLRRLVESQRSLRIKFGQLFLAKKSTQTTYFRYIPIHY